MRIHQKYFGSFNRWNSFIYVHGLSELPADPIQVALYITVLIDKHCSPSVVNSAIYAIKSTHLLNGIVDHTDISFVKSFGRFM